MSELPQHLFSYTAKPRTSLEVTGFHAHTNRPHKQIFPSVRTDHRSSSQIPLPSKYLLVCVSPSYVGNDKLSLSLLKKSLIIEAMLRIPTPVERSTHAVVC
jgi:hypothetical protein